jgi:hypothetical protein
MDIPTILFFYVHPSALRALAGEAITIRYISRSPKILPITVPWNIWGPKTTRWIEVEGWTVRQSLSGSRCAISKWTGEVQLLDFNPERVRRLEYLAENVTKWKHLHKQLVNSQSTINARKYFKHDIVSHLPYFEIMRGRAKGQLLIDDQWVVQTQVKVCLFQFATEY